jgi:hypothetical protein
VDLGIDPLLVAGLSETGIEVPSPIQESAIPVLLSGQNAAIQSYTGSGKVRAQQLLTAVYLYAYAQQSMLPSMPQQLSACSGSCQAHTAPMAASSMTVPHTA